MFCSSGLEFPNILIFQVSAKILHFVTYILNISTSYLTFMSYNSNTWLSSRSFSVVSYFSWNLGPVFDFLTVITVFAEFVHHYVGNLDQSFETRAKWILLQRSYFWRLPHRCPLIGNRGHVSLGSVTIGPGRARRVPPADTARGWGP